MRGKQIVLDFLFKKLTKLESFNFILLCILFLFPLLPIKLIGFIGVSVSVVVISINFRNKKQTKYNKKELLLSFLFF